MYKSNFIGQKQPQEVAVKSAHNTWGEQLVEFGLNMFIDIQTTKNYLYKMDIDKIGVVSSLEHSDSTCCISSRRRSYLNKHSA